MSREGLSRGRVIDLRGQECPKPVLRTLRTIAVSSEREYLVLVDSRDCVDTIKDLVESLDIGEARVFQEESHYKVIIVRR